MPISPFDRVDASIPQSVRGPSAIVNPMDIMQGIESMRAQREQSAALAEQRRTLAEQRQQQVAATKRAEAEERALRSVYSTFAQAGKDVPLGTLSGIVGPERAQKLYDAHVAMKEREVKSGTEAQERFARAIGAVDALPETMRARVYDATVTHAVQSGWLTPDDALPYSPESVAFYARRGMSVEQQANNARAASAEARAAATHAATLPGVQADTTVKTQVAAGTVGGLTPAQQADAARAAAAATETARHNRSTEATARAAAARASSEPLEAVIKDGKSVLVPRSQAVGLTPATNRERTTEDERKSVGWYQQMRDASATIDALEDKLTQQELYQIQSLPHEQLMGMANRNALSEAAKRYLRAFTQFSEARLRSVSGAAISTGEYQSDRQTYGKQFGETPALREDRRRAREVVIGATRERAGVAMPKENTPQTTGGPQPGERRLINGQLAEWDGRGWKAVR